MITLTAADICTVFIFALVTLLAAGWSIPKLPFRWVSFLKPIWVPYVVFYIPLSILRYFDTPYTGNVTPIDVLVIGVAVSLGYVTAAAIRGWRAE